ncbi:MAG: DUF3108 domain-containing protein [Gammaproteobacteria bacterium]|nr:DUF3108 domain-containing protein [Gammaproteobacteria bacterium]
MKKGLILCLGLICSLSSYALSPYEASFDLYASMALGSIKIGNVDYKLEASDDRYVYTSEASVSPLWQTLYNYSRAEESSGLIVNQQLISNYYRLLQRKGDSVDKDFEINIFTDQNFSTINGEKFWKNGPGKIVDELSIYLVLSRDVSIQPTREVFTYQVADSEGIKPQNFTVLGSETIEINGEKLQTIKIECLELRLTLNLSEKHDYLPVLIKKTNGGSRFYLTLTNYKELP